MVLFVIVQSRGWSRALTPKRRPVSHPRSSNRTCGLPASGFPTDFTADSRTRFQLGSTNLHYPQFAEHRVFGEAVGAAIMHLVAPPQEMPYALINVMTNRPIRRCPGSIAEVRRPASQNLIQPVPHLLPGPLVAGHRSSPTFSLMRATDFFDGLAPNTNGHPSCSDAVR